MTTVSFAHWRAAAGSDWGWPFFFPEEMACSGSGRLLVSTDLLDLLVRMRLEWGPLPVNSGYRSPAYNRQIGGVENSFHTQGMAADILIPHFRQRDIERLAERCGAGGIGRYPDRGFVHIDIGPPNRRWTKRGRR